MKKSRFAAIAVAASLVTMSVVAIAPAAYASSSCEANNPEVSLLKFVQAKLLMVRITNIAQTLKTSMELSTSGHTDTVMQ
jgi:hypothetical protein